MHCKSCGEWFSSTAADTELCPACQRAENRLSRYMIRLPEGMSRERFDEIILAETEGRLKIIARPIETTCGSCKHFHPWPGMSSGNCDCRVKHDRRGNPTTEVLCVTQSRKSCRDDYEPREGTP